MFAAITDQALTNDTPVTLLPALGSGKRYVVHGWLLTVQRGTVPTSSDDRYTIKAGTVPISEIACANQPNSYTSAHGHQCGIGEAVTITPSDIPDAATLSGHIEYEVK